MDEKRREKFYSVKEIEQMFKIVREINKITKKEFEIFCQGISLLPSRIVDRVKKDVYFVIL